MRGIHLLGLRDADGARLRFHPQDSAPLVIPWWIPEADREVLLAFYQQVIADDLLVRIEVDWVRAIIPTDRQFLESERRRHGAEDRMVVVRVRRADVDLHDVLAEPSVAAFRRVAIVCEGPARNETVGTLQLLGRVALLSAEARYETLAEEFELRADGRVVLQPIQQQLLNPITAVETFNMLIDLHREGLPPEQHADAVLARVVGRELDALPTVELIGLCALAIRGEAAFVEVAGREAEAVRAMLRARMILRDGRLVGWARRLTEPRHREVMEVRLARCAVPDKTSRMAEKVADWLEETRRSDRSDPLRSAVMDVLGLVNEGQLQRAQQELDALEPQLDVLVVSDETRGLYGLAQGRLLAKLKRWPEAEDSLRGALSRLEGATRGGLVQAGVLLELACGLRDNGRWSEAEPGFREALKLLAEGNATPIERARTQHELARGLRDNGRWSEAEPLFREALKLKMEGNDRPVERAQTQYDLACGLCDNGRWSEAESLFREALWLFTIGNATAIKRAHTQHDLARGLRDNGRWSEAEPLFREALKLLAEGNAIPIDRSFTQYDLACGLCDNGRWSEAEPLFREAIKLAAEGNATPVVRAIPQHELACGLRDNGRWSEAEPLFRATLKLKVEGNDTPTSRAATMHQLARGLRDNGRIAEADALAQEADALLQAAPKP